MRQKSGPPVTVTHLGNHILGFIKLKFFNQFPLKIQIFGTGFMKKLPNPHLWPKLLAVMAKWGSANRPTMVQFEIFKQ